MSEQEKRYYDLYLEMLENNFSDIDWQIALLFIKDEYENGIISPVEYLDVIGLLETMNMQLQVNAQDNVQNLNSAPPKKKSLKSLLFNPSIWFVLLQCVSFALILISFQKRTEKFIFFSTGFLLFIIANWVFILAPHSKDWLKEKVLYSIGVVFFIFSLYLFNIFFQNNILVFGLLCFGYSYTLPRLPRQPIGE